ncbi:DUF1643 domain-containing protein [Ferrimonas balearica]|uniref:DUF1643 domain-containing protein n=1 Tax=Ferrimonas balearica TaxID=44012 RepID=UPI001C999CA0|nr:DUF1643 domain-containing protein [Ferrimonas balearica]MBY5991793.1 DUF1643 domain-containing protein [Ferrimonas balearica]
MERGAVFSPCGRYRYALWRSWAPAAPVLLIVGLNPSRADAQRDDPTSRRCIDFARRWGFGGCWLANLFAYCAAKPAVLATIPDPVGGDNDRWLTCLSAQSDAILVAWGQGGSLAGRDAEVLAGPLSGYRLDCLGRCQAGQPRHPLYVRADAPMQPFEAHTPTH